MRWIFANPIDIEINKKLIKLENKINELDEEIKNMKIKCKEVDNLEEFIGNIIKVQTQQQKEIQILTSKINIIK
jgi:hypothetical protein